MRDLDKRLLNTFLVKKIYDLIATTIHKIKISFQKSLKLKIILLKLNKYQDQVQETC